MKKTILKAKDLEDPYWRIIELERQVKAVS